MGLVSAGDRQLNVRISGNDTGLASIVLENGGGGILDTWASLEQALAPHACVLNYERAGIGLSGGPADDVSAAAVTQRLDALLSATRTPAPVILVGHSLGGLYARHFAASRPDLVAGLVLLDSTPTDLAFPRFYSVKPTLAMWLLWGVARIGLLERIARRGKLAPSLIAAIGRYTHIRSVLAEIGALRDVQAEVARTTLPAKLPVLALSAGARTLEPQAHRDQFHSSHAQIAAAAPAPHSRHQRIEGATHMSMLTDPRHANDIAAQILLFARLIGSATLAA